LLGFFKRLVKYIQGSSTCIGQGYEFLGANGGEEDLLAEADDELLVEDGAISKILKTELHAARGTVFKFTATNAKNDKLEVYNHRHLSQALRKGGNTTLFAIAILKLVVVFGLPLRKAIQRARSTYYFSNLLARSVALSNLESKKATEEALKERGKLASFDLSVFLNPDALKRLVCILHSKLDDERRSPVVDFNNNAAQIQAWKEFNKVASGTPAPKDLINPEFFACSMSQLIGLFSSATRVFFGSGNGEQYDFRRIGSIARLKWRQNVTYGIRDALRAKREQENELDDSDYTARVERLKFKIKLAKSSSERRKTPNDDDDNGLQKTSVPLFPLRDEDITGRLAKALQDNTCMTCDETATRGTSTSLEREERERIRAPEGNQQRQNNRNINNNGKRARPKRHVCHVCEKAFIDSSALDIHLRVHSGEKPFKCHICDEAFAQSNNLTKHLRVHSGEKPFKCHVCEKAFSDSSTLTKHLRVHSGEKPFKCHVCERAFSESGSLTSHLRVHSGEKPYKCHVCDEAFTQSGSSRRHMRRKHHSL
jgi:glass